MPNWTWNKIVVSGSKSALAEFVAKYKLSEEANKFDFDLIVPEPRRIEDCPILYQVESAIAAGITEDKERPWFDWYTWHNRFWGTKWNACDSSISISDTRVIICFNTAWSHPQPIFNALKEQNPKLNFHFHWEDE